MDAKAYHELMLTIRKLDDFISKQRYKDSRGGMIPPEEMHYTVVQIEDATETLTLLLSETRLLEAQHV